ncbi:flagellar hook-basal body protein [Peribacillus sp. FSL H8-0477]|uniref:flagellar hook-basal body protein n=1 Tax=Peribacillus sp. FSL H8-0477 TaxID=2921388 RepID=UPI0030F4D950
MNRMMITATNTLGQLQHKLDSIGNNIANVDTTGFKRSETSFNDLLVQQFNNMGDTASEIGRLTPNGIRQGNGAKLGQAQQVLTQGALKSTNRDLDMAFTKPDLFFTVRTEDEKGISTAYTRDGAFYLTPTGNTDEMMLVTGDGNAVLDEYQDPIIISGSLKNLVISKSGQLSAAKDDGSVQTFNLGVVSIKKPQFMEKTSGNLLSFPNDLNVQEAEVFDTLNGGLREEITLTQGSLENSNVDLSKEMTDLINVQRQYQFQSRAISMADQMSGLVNGIR